MSEDIKRVMEKIISCLNRAQTPLTSKAIVSLAESGEPDEIRSALTRLSQAGLVNQLPDSQAKQTKYAIGPEKRPSFKRDGLADSESLTLRQLIARAHAEGERTAVLYLKEHLIETAIGIIRRNDGIDSYALVKSVCDAVIFEAGKLTADEVLYINSSADETYKRLVERQIIDQRGDRLWLNGRQKCQPQTSAFA